MTRFNDSFRAARWIRLINLFLQAALFLALFGGLNYIALNRNWRFDLTTTHRHSLSAETKSYLGRLERPVTITVTLTEDDDNDELAQAYRDITGLLREYAYLTNGNPHGKITVRHINIYQNRREAEALNLDQPNQVIVQSDEHRRVLWLPDFYRTKDRRREAFQGEAALTAAILDVSNPDKKKIYFLAGHSEARLDDIDGATGLSQLRDNLRQRNFALDSLDLSLSRKIPDDADLLVITSPKGRYQPHEEELLRNYLQTRAGRLLVFLDPGVQPGLDNLFFDWGVLVHDKLIIDLDPNSLLENGDLRYWRFLADPDSHITDNLINNALPIIVGPTRPITNDLGLSPDEGLNVKRLIATSEKAWGEANYRQRIPFEFTPGQDLKGEIGVMAISERVKPAHLPLSVRGGRLAVFGFSDLVTNNRINNVGNLNLFLATVNWAVDRDTQVNIPARPIERFQLALSEEELTRLRFGLLLGVPGLAALFGLIIWWTRRN